jgi:putative transposase
VDHGNEYQSRALAEWAYHRTVQLVFIRPGKPAANALIEAFNGRLRDEYMNLHHKSRRSPRPHTSLKPGWWTIISGPHSSLGHLTPNEFVGQRQAITVAKEVVCSG